MNLQLNISLLSKYRTQLMGFAMLWVIWTHAQGLYTAIPLINFIKGNGYAGVDIFLFLSGIGNFFSLKGDQRVLSFYKRRLLRIFPVYMVIALLYAFMRIEVYDSPVSIIFYLVTTLFTWQNRGPVFQEGFGWYIAFILVIYLITPFFSKFFKKNPLLATLIMVFSGFVITFLLLGTEFNCFTLMSSRIPIYFIGYFFGYLLSKKVVLNLKWGIIMFFAFLIGAAMITLFTLKLSKVELWIYGLYWYPYILITPPLCLFLALMFSCFDKYKYPVLSFFGTYSLPIYLTHDRIFDYLQYIGLLNSRLLQYLLAILISAIFSYLLQNIIDKLIHRKKNNNLPSL